MTSKHLHRVKSCLGSKKTRKDLFHPTTGKINRNHGLIPFAFNPVNNPGTKDAVGNSLAGS